tara:strand:+ start:416 stop:1240 length:825 start_codon:yes stop_codon:yes gene_type:complete
MARKKGGEKLIEMARKGQRKQTDPKPKVAGEPKFRLGPVGPEGPAEAFDWNVAPESPGILERLLSKLTKGGDYSQPVEPRQAELEAELGEAKDLLKQIEDRFKKIEKFSKEPDVLPSEMEGHKERVAKEVKAQRVEDDAKRKKIRKQFAPIRLENIPELNEPLPKVRKEKKKERVAKAVEEVEGEDAFIKLEAETMKLHPYPSDDHQIISIYEQIARGFEKEIGAPADYIRNEAIHTLIHTRVDPAFNKFYDNITLINPEDGEVEEFTGELQGE